MNQSRPGRILRWCGAAGMASLGACTVAGSHAQPAPTCHFPETLTNKEVKVNRDLTTDDRAHLDIGRKVRYIGPLPGTNQFALKPVGPQKWADNYVLTSSPNADCEMTLKPVVSTQSHTGGKEHVFTMKFNPDQSIIIKSEEHINPDTGVREHGGRAHLGP